MSIYKGLAGFFLIVFLVMGIGFVSLAVEDNNDLSSRAGSMISPANNYLENYGTPTTVGSWDGRVFGLGLTIDYRPEIWSNSKNDQLFVYKNGIGWLKVLGNEKIDDKFLNTFLGADFKLVEKQGQFEEGGWLTTAYIYKSFGRNRLVKVISSRNGLNMIAVGEIETADLNGFVGGAKLVGGSKVLGALTDRMDIVKSAALVRPSVVMIVSSYCNDLKLGADSKDYPFCIASTGSGFFVNSDGYIATNGHVLKENKNEVILSALQAGELKELVKEAVKISAKTVNATIADDELNAMVKNIYAKDEKLVEIASVLNGMIDQGGAVLGTEQYRYYVQLGRVPMSFGEGWKVKLNDDVLEAKMVDIDYSDFDEASGFNGSDVALLKVNGSNYPALPLIDSNGIKEGMEISVLGFPGLVSGMQKGSFLDLSAMIEPTITKGLVSAIKMAKGDKKRLVQTDATINTGNSGGPAVSLSGEVVGIATYGLSPKTGSGNYNFLRDIEDLRALMKKNKIDNVLGESFQKWKSGLENYWLSYYRFASDDMKVVAANYRQHPTVELYMSDALSKVASIEDKTPRYTRSERKTMMEMFGLGMVVSLFGCVGFWVWDRSRTNGGGGYIGLENGKISG